jgi:hypothetical protein
MLEPHWVRLHDHDHCLEMHCHLNDSPTRFSCRPKVPSIQLCETSSRSISHCAIGPYTQDPFLYENGDYDAQMFFFCSVLEVSLLLLIDWMKL